MFKGDLLNDFASLGRALDASLARHKGAAELAVREVSQQQRGAKVAYGKRRARIPQVPLLPSLFEFILSVWKTGLDRQFIRL